MKRLSHFMLGFGIVVVFLALMISSGLAQFPDPKDEAKLYELAKKEGTIVWYGSAPLESMKANADDFQAKYPGIKMEILRLVGVSGYQRFLQETNAKTYLADIVYISDYPSMQSLLDLGHLAEWKVPTADRIHAAFRMGNHSYSPNLVDNVIAYNTNKVTPEEVKILDNSWKGILDPRFKGRFAVTSMKCSTCYAAIHMFLDPKNAKVFGPEFIKAVAAQKPTVYSEILVALDRVVAGEHDFTYWSFEAAAYLKWLQGAPIRWIHPEPTPEYGNSWYSVSKYAPHPNAARLFQNWITSEAGALSMERGGFRTALEGFKDSRKMSAESWYDPIKTRYNVDFDRWAKNYHKDMDFWIKMMREGK